MKRLKAKVSEFKETSIAKFKESNAYRFDLTKVVVLFLTNERINIKRHLQRLYQIKDIGFFDKINQKPIFSDTGDDEEKEEREEVTQDDL